MNYSVLKTCKVALSVVALAGAATASAQGGAFPTKTIDITVPFAAGGGVDLLARIIGSQLTSAGHTVVVENRPGAGGTLAARYVAGRPKDGHSLLMMNDAYSLAPALFKSLGYDPKKDLEPVINVAWAPMLVLVPANSKFKSLADIVAAGSKPGASLSYGSCGTGTDPHLAGEMLNISFKMRSTHVPYKGCAPALVDTLAGTLDYSIATISGALPHVASGKLRALGITSLERSKVVPDVPTIAESGAPGYHLSQWQGLAVPAGTPEATKQTIYRTVSTLMKAEAVQKKLMDSGYTPADDNPAAFQKIVHEDIERFAALAKKIGLTLD